MWNDYCKEKLAEIRAEKHEAGGRERINRIHKESKLTASERMHKLFDKGEYSEIQALRKSRIDTAELKKKHYLGDGIIAGFGKVNGKNVYAIAQDASISGGAGGEAHVQKICSTLKLAINNKCPMVYLCESGGARIEEGILSLAAYSELFHLNQVASGYIPQIAAIMGNCAGGSSYSPVMCDFLLMVNEKAQLFITGPKVIKNLIGEDISMNDLGGTKIHKENSGQAHIVCENDIDCIDKIKELLKYTTIKKPKDNSDNVELNYFESSNGKELLEEIVPDNSKNPYDVTKVIKTIVDEGKFLEILPFFAKNIVIGFARIGGRSIGIVANQPLFLSGSIDCDAADKASRFIRTCDCYDIPILTLVDVPGFYPGASEEKKGILRHGAKLLYSYSEASVPKITVILRKAYGGAYCAMNSKGLGADIVYAWPICEIAVMGEESAVEIIYGKEIKNENSPAMFIKEKAQDYKEKFLNPFYAAYQGMIDEVILPEETRDRLISAYSALQDKRVYMAVSKKHGNITL